MVQTARTLFPEGREVVTKGSMTTLAENGTIIAVATGSVAAPEVVAAAGKLATIKAANEAFVAADEWPTSHYNADGFLSLVGEVA